MLQFFLVLLIILVVIIAVLYQLNNKTFPSMVSGFLIGGASAMLLAMNSDSFMQLLHRNM
jgi:RsiW-degrading membrane proteinase PrsW (M82 family)